MDSLKIAGLNFDILWKDKNKNLIFIEEKVKNISVDLILLPEMFSTGFCMEATEIADRNEETLHWMKGLASSKKSA